MNEGVVLDILLVEDNDDDVTLLEEGFTEFKNAKLMETVRDGEQALACLKREGPYKNALRPALILLDINMPKKNGFEVLDEMKQNEDLRHIPVVMLTSSAREEEIIRSYAKGACSFITKPNDFDILRSSLKTLLSYWSNVAKVPQWK